MGNRWNGPVVGSQALLPEPKLMVETTSLGEGGESQETISGYSSNNKVTTFSKIVIKLEVHDLTEVEIRLLHPQDLDGIWIVQDQYRLPIAPLIQFPEPWC